MKVTSYIRYPDPEQSLENRLQRIFVEKGNDFFESNDGKVLEVGFLESLAQEPSKDENEAEDVKKSEESRVVDDPSASLSPEQLVRLRADLYQKLQ
jgi:hypothetical protein